MSNHRLIGPYSVRRTIAGYIYVAPDGSRWRLREGSPTNSWRGRARVGGCVVTIESPLPGEILNIACSLGATDQEREEE